MSEIRLPPVDPGNGDQQEVRPPAKEPDVLKGCLQIVLILVLGVFVLAGLVFATCFLSLRR
jgi:hypothetical protein